MVMTLSRTILFLFILGTFASASDFRVQGPNGPFKSSQSVAIGQRFECLQDTRLVIYDCPILFLEGTIGYRASESVFYISKGAVRVGALKPAPSFGTPRPPLTFRFYRGVLEATGLEWLIVDELGMVRWLKEANTGLSEIQIDGKRCKGEEGTLLVAEDRQWLVFAPKEGSTFTMDELRSTRLESLRVQHRLLREAQASIASRTRSTSRSQGEEHWERERRKIRTTLLQEGRHP